jgi:hypothetical protein
MESNKEELEITTSTASEATSTVASSVDYLDFSSISNVNQLTGVVWGETVKQDIFERWSQGFIFNAINEPTALLQNAGGPCSIIAAVQAFLLRELLFCPNCLDWRRPTGEYKYFYSNFNF